MGLRTSHCRTDRFDTCWFRRMRMGMLEYRNLGRFTHVALIGKPNNYIGLITRS